MSAQNKQVKPLDVYSLPTPNGQKITILLAELGLDYKYHHIDIMKGDQFKPDFVEISPNSKIPAIVDHAPIGGDSKPLALFESGNILEYLAEKSNKLLPTDPTARWITKTWLYWQMASVGPMLGQAGHFIKYAKENVPYGIKRYGTEAKRLFGVLDKQLAGRKYVAGDELTIADIAIWPWIGTYEGIRININAFPEVKRWYNDLAKRPSFATGSQVGKKEAGW